jgi:hypothetical protein
MPKKSPPRWTVGSDSPIKIDRDFAAELRQAAAELAPDALIVMETTIEAFRAQIAKDWPVSPYVVGSDGVQRNYRRSGNKIPSATTWSAYGSVTSNGLIGSIGNPAKYTQILKSSQNGLDPGRSAYQQLVKDPARQVAVKLGQDISRSIVKTVTSDT